MVEISKINIADNRRAVDQNKVIELAESIKQIGLINPIAVRIDEKYNYYLVAGLHRLEAYKLLGYSHIEATIHVQSDLEAELMEIDENLIRNDIHYTERGELLRRKKEIYEELYPETKAGVAGGKASGEVRSTKTETDFVQKPSFVKDTAEKTGRSETVIKEELQIANNVIPEAKPVLQEQNITKTEAIKLSREDTGTQKKIIPIFESGQTKKVEEAKKIIDPIDEQYDKDVEEIEARHKRVKKVMNLLNYTQHLGITEQSVLEYMEEFPKGHFDFVSRLNRLQDIINETIEFYNKLQQIRVVK